MKVKHDSLQQVRWLKVLNKKKKVTMQATVPTIAWLHVLISRATELGFLPFLSAHIHLRMRLNVELHPSPFLTRQRTTCLPTALSAAA